MVSEVLDCLALREGGIYVDGTLGLGGHALAIMEACPRVRLIIGVDQDQDTLEIARSRLAGLGDAVRMVHGNFCDIPGILAEMGIEGVDGILLDLGISSFQLEHGGRGFSFQREELLDMRMDRSGSVTAADMVNNLPEEQLAELIYTYGEERWSRRIADAIIRRREIQPILTSADLARIISQGVPARFHSRRIHPATRTFQALRIAVNRELENLREALDILPSCLNPEGRFCIISFHSLEDRLVKDAFRSDARLRALTKKPLVPARDEVRGNPRARSAKLRAAERIAGRDETVPSPGEKP